MKKITLPIGDEEIRGLTAGEVVSLSGVIYSARDAAHKRLAAAIAGGEELPFDIRGQGIYYLGPTPAKPGQVIGSAGPTSSYRMDPYTPMLLEKGLKVMVGKGKRSDAVAEAIRKNTAVYFAAIGGSAALLSKCILSSELVAYEDLGTEAIRRLTVKDMPVIVAMDCYGNDQYRIGVENYLKALDQQQGGR